MNHPIGTPLKTLAALGVFTAGAALAACSADDVSALLASVRPTAVTVSGVRNLVQVNDTLRLVATALDSTGKPMSLAGVPGLTTTWAQTAGDGIVLVDRDGLVHGNSVGSATVTATIATVSGSMTLTVANVPADSVAFSSLGLGCPVSYRTSVSVQTFAKGSPVSVKGRAFVWSVGNDQVVRLLPDTSVAWSRTIECAGPGATSIVVAVDGLKATFPVTVVP